MNLVKRKYQPGDEVNINKLYKLITGIDRRIDEYHWEWIDTWNGQGSIWLAFDEERKDGDKLVMQYSLIPTPFSFWGESYLAGKTENCMSHPDLRGKGLYFTHEQECFEEAKRHFQIFFTTAGDVAKGAPGAIRRKLGYVALDSWVEYFFLTDTKYVQDELCSRFDNKSNLAAGMTKFFSSVISKVLCIYFEARTPERADVETELFDVHNAPLDKIAEMWNRNKKFYGITVDRNRAYLAWRINQNPFFTHRYLILFSDETVMGYIIFYRTGKNIFRIVDMLAERKDISIFVQLLAQMIALSKEEGVGGIVCSTLKGNKLLAEVFRKSGFLRKESLSVRKIFSRKKAEKPFHIYVSERVPDFKKAYDCRNLYITGLVTEGRR